MPHLASFRPRGRRTPPDAMRDVTHRPRPMRGFWPALCLALVLAGCRKGDAGIAASRASATGAASVRIVAVLADPRDVPDSEGEWFGVRNMGRAQVDLRGWRIASGGDAPVRIDRSLPIAPGAEVALGRGVSASSGPVDWVWTMSLALGNGDDWVALRDARGRSADSVAWLRAPRGTVMRFDEASRARRTASSSAGPAAPAASTGRAAPTAGGAIVRAPLVVRVLDVGQGDAILVENGGSRVLVDGGPDGDVLGRHLDALGLDGDTIDVVIVTHGHLDHYNGLRELFRSRRRIVVRYLFDTGDPSPNTTLRALRDSAAARARRGTLEYRDADDPCGDGRPSCSIALRGGAMLQLFRPYPAGAGASPNDRSVPVRLLGPDTAAFTMWLAGDAERDAIAWMERQGYPMRSRVLKLGHHGSCDAITERHLRRVAPELAVASLTAANDYGYMHAQVRTLLKRRRVPWLRTDQNGTVTLRAPGTAGRAYDVLVGRGVRNAVGPMDRVSRQEACRGGT